MNLQFYILLFVVLLLADAAYMYICRKWVPRAVTRSAASVTGGGFIFFPAAVGAAWCSGPCGIDLQFAIAGCLIVWIVSFIDDMKSLSAVLRLIVQILMAALASLPMLYFGPWWCLLMVVIMVTMMNSCNFMDGIGGMLALWMLVTFPALWIQLHTLLPQYQDVATGLTVAAMAFAVFNVVMPDRLYSGDVGSVVAGFFAGWIIALLIIVEDNPIYIVFSATFLVDTLYTLAARALRGENLLRPHKQHLYQQLVIKYRYSHHSVALGYALVQLVANAGVLLLPADLAYYWLGFVFGLLISLRYLLPRRLK